MIVQNIGASGHTDFSFTVNRNEYQRALSVLAGEREQKRFQAREVIGDNRIAKVSVVGIGMIAGHPGLGKSQIAIAMSAVITKVGRWPVDGTPCDPGTVMILSAEDDVADTIRPRLEAAGADLAKVEVLDGVIDAFDTEGNPISRPLNLRTEIGRAHV